MPKLWSLAMRPGDERRAFRQMEKRPEYARAPPSEVDVGEQEKDLTHIQARAAPIESGIVVEFELLPV